MTEKSSEDAALPIQPIATTQQPAEPPLTVIEPVAGWQALELVELWRYRELLYFLTWRDIKVRYKQTLVGVLWAVLQPALMMVVFTLVLQRLAGVTTADTPYPLFVYAGLLPWTFFSTAVHGAAQSVVLAERLVTKVYFPRLAIPLAAVGAALVDFGLAAIFLPVLMAWYGHPVSWSLLLVPFVAGVLALAAIGFGAALAALNVAYRDVRHALPFVMQLWLFATPSIYLDRSAIAPGQPAEVASQSPTQREAPAGQATVGSPAYDLLALNPIDGLIAFFRAAVLGLPLPWSRLTYPLLIVPVVVALGGYYFRRVEASFADVL